jgi:kumamolisin
MRNAPDISLNADPNTGYYIYCSICTSGGWLVIGGTSAVAPQLAAFWSLVSKGLGSRAGFANPTLYAAARGSASYSSSFHDVTSGNNGYYNASTGFDNATGLGSYNGAALYSALLRSKNAGIMVLQQMMMN